MRNAITALLLASLTVASAAFGDDSTSAPAKNLSGTAFVSVDKTNIDFSETLIDGKMQAPQGFFLQGRQGQTMSQMVRLRSKFRSEMRNSKSAVKALVK